MNLHGKHLYILGPDGEELLAVDAFDGESIYVPRQGERVRLSEHRPSSWDESDPLRVDYVETELRQTQSTEDSTEFLVEYVYVHTEEP